jgi:hypothetical protein
MTNLIGYNQLPDEVEFKKLYDTMHAYEMCEYYKCQLPRIRKWIKHFGLPPKQWGGGHNRKYDIDKDTLQNLVDAGYTNKQICNILNINCKSSLGKWLKKYNIKRKESNRTDYQKYKSKVYALSEKNYKQHKDVINPNDYPRGLCGVPESYQLDHIIAITDCYKYGYTVEEASAISNLQMLTWKDNLDKRY